MKFLKAHFLQNTSGRLLLEFTQNVLTEIPKKLFCQVFIMMRKMNCFEEMIDRQKANQLTCFYMTATLAFNALTLT